MDQMILKKRNHETIPKYKVGKVDERLLADVVHKIKNGLGGIGGFATLLERDLESDDPRKRLAVRIQEGVQKVNEIVVSLMTLVRMTEPCLKKVKLPTMLRNIYRDYNGYDKREFPAITYHPDILKDDLVLNADPQLIQKMLVNAFRFTQFTGGGIESIQVKPKHKDNINIELYYLNNLEREPMPENIFRLLNVVEPIEARLSLAIVLEISKLHGGRVTIRTNNDNQTVFIMQLAKGR